MDSIRKRCTRGSFVIAVGLLLCACASGHAAETPTSGGKALKAPGSMAEALAQSVTITSIPPNLTPPLSDFTSESARWSATARSIVGDCDAMSSTKLQESPQPCFLGDPTGTKTIVLAGDSNAAGWAPALDQGLRTSGYRLAVFPFSGCPLSDMTYTGLVSGKSPAGCNTWHKSVSPAIASLHPDAVILASVAGIPGVDLKSPQWSTGIKTFFDSVSSGATPPVRILFGTVPEMGASVPECLSAHPNPQDCSVTGRYWQLFQANTLTRDRKNAQIAGATLIPAVQFLCAPKGCSPVIENFMVYVDGDHLTMAYARHVSRPVTNRVLGVIRANHR